MNMKDVCEAGSDIMNAVADAVETNDYSNLSKDNQKSCYGCDSRNIQNCGRQSRTDQ